MVFAYADPPYPGKASLYPERQEVDHASLVDRLERDFPAGCAIGVAWTRFSRRHAIAPAPSDASPLEQASAGTAVPRDASRAARADDEDASHLQEAA